MCEMYTNLPQSQIEKLSSWSPSLYVFQGVVEHIRVVFHSVGFVQNSIYQIVGVDVIFDEVVQGKL